GWGSRHHPAAERGAGGCWLAARSCVGGRNGIFLLPQSARPAWPPPRLGIRTHRPCRFHRRRRAQAGGRVMARYWWHSESGCVFDGDDDDLSPAEYDCAEVEYGDFLRYAFFGKFPFEPMRVIVCGGRDYRNQKRV